MLCEIICDHFKQPRIQFYRQRFEYRFPYCDCPYSELCKHEVAVAITLRMLFKQPQFKNAGDFMALDRWVFWQLASRADRITI